MAKLRIPGPFARTAGTAPSVATRAPPRAMPPALARPTCSRVCPASVSFACWRSSVRRCCKAAPDCPPSTAGPPRSPCATRRTRGSAERSCRLRGRTRACPAWSRLPDGRDAFAARVLLAEPPSARSTSSTTSGTTTCPAPCCSTALRTRRRPRRARAAAARRQQHRRPRRDARRARRASEHRGAAVQPVRASAGRGCSAT